jgi:hypothetical protein
MKAKKIKKKYPYKIIDIIKDNGREVIIYLGVPNNSKEKKKCR